MRTLSRKLGRDLLGNAGTLVSVVAIIAVGTGCFIGMGSAVRILSLSRATYYGEYRFADFWVHVKKAPLTAVERIARLEGMEAVEGRVVFEVILDVPGEERPLTGRLLSTPRQHADRTLNGLCLVRGSGFSDDRREELILSEAFAREHGLAPGDRVGLILNRKRQSFVIAGTAISPEYVYMVRGEGDLVPDPKHFGILYVEEGYAREVLDFQDACNEVVGRVVGGADADVEAMAQDVARILHPYGVLSTTPRERQASHRFLSDEIEGGRVSSTLIPGIFLLVAALVLNVVMSRFAERQRSIIGTLKALGYSNKKVFLHFLAFGVAVGVVGGIVGNILGIALAAGMVEMYKGFYQFPRFVYEVYPDLLVIGMIISVVFALVGTAKGVWSVLRLEPAEAMRQKPPERGGMIFLEHFPRLWKRLGFRTQMAMRSLVRNRFRTMTGVLATALAGSLIMLSLIMYDSLWFLVDFQFDRIVHSDVDIGLRDEQSIAGLYEARQLPGVDYAEPLLGVRCDLRNGRYERRMGIMGLAYRHRLTTPVRADLEPIEIPREGLVMSRKLAELLDLKEGDSLEVKPVRGRREPVQAHLASIVESYIGLDCYADLHYLSSLVGEYAAVNSVQTTVDPPRRADLYRTLKGLPNAQGLSVAADTRANIEGTFLTTMSGTLWIVIIFAGIIAGGSILNNALIEIGDGVRDISTLRVVGYQPRQIAAIFFRQSMITTAIGIVIALPLSYGLTLALVQAYNTELYRMPVVVKAPTVLLSAGMMVAFVLLAQAVVYRQIRKLDWLEGIKVKE